MSLNPAREKTMNSCELHTTTKSRYQNDIERRVRPPASHYPELAPVLSHPHPNSSTLPFLVNPNGHFGVDLQKSLTSGKGIPKGEGSGPSTVALLAEGSKPWNPYRTLDDIFISLINMHIITRCGDCAVIWKH
ncbi:hypothetical protein GX48_00142 [Paracoccidioides brasiliensis]|nr:hypothetical protein GX48_00142 [Paracoccidioides brasiliensis]